MISPGEGRLSAELKENFVSLFHNLAIKILFEFLHDLAG
tara:strand:+ start:9599 stop:9715 length:117 start_codon:yes stop_codon:yes gene_type:complete